MGAVIMSARRTLHPGPPRADRVAVAVAPRPRRALVWLPEGETLHNSLVSAFARFGVRAGILHLLGGYLSSAVYHVAVPRDDSVRAAEYGPPIRIEGGARLVRASGSYGEDLSGLPLLHIHGALAEPTGKAHGGHISPHMCVVGPGGVRAILMLTVGFKQVIDRETRYSLFFPYSEVTAHAPIHHSGDQHWSRGERARGAERGSGRSS
jgi:predicted DNA-binding protein with PD1-like motif